MKGFKSNLMVLTAVLLLAGNAAVFAGGQSEAPNQTAPNGAATQAPQVTVAKDLTTLTGTVQIVNLIHPILKSGSTNYELIVPRFDVYQTGVKEGQTITVKGYKVEGGVWGPYSRTAQASDTTPRLLVSSATIDGKTYNLQQWADQFKAGQQYRGGYGPMAGYGPRERGRRAPRGGYGPQMGYGPGPGMGYGMGYGFQGSDSN